MRKTLTFLLITAACAIGQTANGQTSRTMAGSNNNAKLDAESKWNVDRKLAGYGWPAPQLGITVPAPALMELYSDGDIADLRGLRFRAVQILDEQNMLVSVGDSTYWLTGADTKEVSNGSVVRLATPVLFDGKKEYSSVVGSLQIVKVLSLISKEKYNEKKAVELILKSGEKLKLVYVETNKKGHVFEHIDGTVVTHAMASFDEPSQKAVRKLIEEAKKASKPKKR